MDSNVREKRWDVKREAKIISGLSFNNVKNLILRGLIKEDDLIWHADLSGWRKASQQEELMPFFSTSGGLAAAKRYGEAESAPGGNRSEQTDKKNE